LAIIVCLVVCVVDVFALLFYLRWTNLGRDKRQMVETIPEHQEKHDIAPGSQLLDVTDLKNQEFRYAF
jgi:ACS family allantoate permease-like MFS transporter